MKKVVLLFLLAVAAAWPALAATRSVTFTVTGWTCGSCAASTRIALKKLDGVEEVKTDQQKMEAAVIYDDSKVTPEKMIQTIQRLGYKATVKASPSGAALPGPPRGGTVDASQPAERISFFEVSLECGAVEGLGCGSASKPILRSLERDARVAEAKINYCRDGARCRVEGPWSGSLGPFRCRGRLQGERSGNDAPAGGGAGKGAAGVRVRALVRGE